MEETKQIKTCAKCGIIQSVEAFSKHSGTKDKLDNRCKSCVKLCKKKSLSEVKEYPIYELDYSKKDWQVGKPTGSVLHRKDSRSGSERYEVRIPLGDGKLKSKSFSFSNYDNSTLANEAAHQWLKEFSKENGLTRNMIKVVDENTIMVKLSKDMIMTTDIKFSDICQKHVLCSTKNGKVKAEYYALINVNNVNQLFHKYITEFDMTDHINRNPMDNRLCNLRQTTPKLNNNNRQAPKKYRSDEFHVLGVRFVQKDESWQARIKQDNKEYTKSFSIRKHGYEEAKQMAIEARKQLNEKFECENS